MLLILLGSFVGIVSLITLLNHDYKFKNVKVPRIVTGSAFGVALFAFSLFVNTIWYISYIVKGREVMKSEKRSWNQIIKDTKNNVGYAILFIIVLISLYFSSWITFLYFQVFSKLNDSTALSQLLTPTIFEMTKEFVLALLVFPALSVLVGFLLYIAFYILLLHRKFKKRHILYVAISFFSVSSIIIFAGSLDSEQFSIFVGILSALALSFQLAYFLKNLIKI